MSARVHPECDARCHHEGVVPVFPGPKRVVLESEDRVAVHCGPPAFLPSAPAQRTEEPVKAAQLDTADLPPHGTRAYFAELNRRTAAMRAPVRLLPHPAPLVTSAEHVDVVAPAPFVKLQDAARAAGWVTLAQYAEGYVPHATTGRPSVKPKPSHALRMAHPDGRRAVAVYEKSSGWSWSSLWAWHAAMPYQRLPTLAAMGTWLREGALP